MTAPLFHADTARAMCRDPYFGDYAESHDLEGMPPIDEATGRVASLEEYVLACDATQTYAQHRDTGAVYEAIDSEWREVNAAPDPLVDAALAIIRQSHAECFRSDQLVDLARAAADAIDAEKRPGDHRFLRAFDVATAC